MTAPWAALLTASPSAASAPEVSKTVPKPPSVGRAADAPSETASCRRPSSGSSTCGVMPRASSAMQSRAPCEPVPMTRQSPPGLSPERLIAACATVSGSTQTASASVQPSGTGQANRAGTATRSASRPGTVKPTMARCWHIEVTPPRQGGQRRQG
jgi:hypothetical protein